MGTEQQERDARIAVLERRLQRRSPLGVTAPIAGPAVVLALAAIWIFERKDWAYYLSPVEPISLGREGEDRWERLQCKPYADIHGEPATRGLPATEPGG